MSYEYARDTTRSSQLEAFSMNHSYLQKGIMHLFKPNGRSLAVA